MWTCCKHTTCTAPFWGCPRDGPLPNNGVVNLLYIYKNAFVNAGPNGLASALPNNGVVNLLYIYKNAFVNAGPNGLASALQIMVW